MNRGDIVLMTFPFSDLSSTKVRPALIVSPVSNADNDIIVALISSNTIRSSVSTDFILPSSHSYFSLTGLKVESIFRMSKLHNLTKSLAKRRIGKVSEQLMKDLEIKLRLALGI